MIKSLHKTIYKKTTAKILFSITFVSVLFSSFFAQKAFAGIFGDRLVPCDGIDDCNFEAIISLLNNVITLVMFRLPLILLIFVFAYNGINLIIYRDRPAMIKIIKKNLINVFLGYILILGAYIIVKTFIVLLAGSEDLGFKVFFN